MSTILSDAHELVQAMPLSANRLLCIRCGYSRPMRLSDSVRCRPHAEAANSGWAEMSK